MDIKPLADQLAQDREHLLAQLEAARPRGRYAVVRQLFVAGEVVDQPVSHHRYEWVAQLWAHHRERQHGHEAGGHYTVRRAES